MKVTPAQPAACHCIIKLGGSAITNKHNLETLKLQTLQHICSSIKELHSRAPGGIVLVHGAGSFGHFQASSYGVARGGNDAAAAVQGFVETRQSVTHLNHHVVSALIAAGVPAVGLSPCGTWQCSGRQLQDAAAGVAAAAAVLQHGMVPVLHGDCVFDSQLGVTILSGDTIMRGLAEALQPSYCVFLTDVPGLFTKPPEQPGAVLIPAVEVAQDGTWSVPLLAAPSQQQRQANNVPAADGGSGSPVTAEGSSASPLGLQLSTASHDTTGGIAAKVAEAAAVAVTGCPVVIAQAGTAAGTTAVLHGPAGFAGGSSDSRTAGVRSGLEEQLQATVVRAAVQAPATSTP